MKKITTVKKRRREPGEIATRAIAIRNHCLECTGYIPAEVKICCGPKCWLYPYRLGRETTEELAK